MSKINRGNVVKYQSDVGNVVQAVVLTSHRDGSYTVESQFVLDDAGKPRPCYLGFKYRLGADDLVQR